MKSMLRRRASVPKDFGTTLPDMPAREPDREHSGENVDVSRLTIHGIVSGQSQARQLMVIRTIRVMQILLGPVLIALSASLLNRYTALRRSCVDGIDDQDCATYKKAIGAFKYCIFPGIWSTLEGVIGLRVTYTQTLPMHLIIGLLDSPAGGFHMGGGCTLAAMVNGWDCKASGNGERNLCNQLYTAIALFFTGVVMAYAMLPLLGSSRKCQERNR